MNTLEIIRNGLMQCIEKIDKLARSVVNLLNRATTLESKIEQNKNLISKVITCNSICALHSIDDGSNMLFEDGIAELNEYGNNGPERYIVSGFPNRITFYRNSKEIIFFNFDTSAVTDMSYMFYNCSNLTTLNLSNFDTSAVTNMSYMFSQCSNLTTLNLSNFDTSAVTNMSYMFDGCSNLTTLDLSSFNTSSVTNMNGMFGYCKKLTTLDLSSFNTSAVTNMYSTFYDCTSLTTIIGTHTLEEVQTGQIKALKGMKVSLDLSYSPLLERASILAVFYGLADLTGKTAQTVTLHATAKARLTAEDIK